MSEFALQIQDIDETGKDYLFELTRAWLDATLAEANLRADPNAGQGALEVHAQKNGAEYLIEGRLTAALITECGRCLGPAAVLVDTRFATLFYRTGPASGVRGGQAAGKAPADKAAADAGGAAGKSAKGAKGAKSAENRHQSPSHAHEVDETFDAEDDELAREPFSGYGIVLDPLIREYLVLECPMQPLCSDACKGIAVPEHVRPPEDVFGTTDAKLDPRLAPLLRLRDKVPPNKE